MLISSNLNKAWFISLEIKLLQDFNQVVIFNNDTFVQKCNISYFAFKTNAKVYDNIKDDGSILGL